MRRFFGVFRLAVCGKRGTCVGPEDIVVTEMLDPNLKIGFEEIGRK
jgi:hypothetical protein